MCKRYYTANEIRDELAEMDEFKQLADELNEVSSTLMLVKGSYESFKRRESEFNMGGFLSPEYEDICSLYEQDISELRQRESEIIRILY